MIDWLGYGLGWIARGFHAIACWIHGGRLL